MKEFLRRLLYLRRGSRFHEELDQEIEFHIETRTDELEQSGVPRLEAIARARREFGHTPFVRESARAAWQIRWMEDLFADVQYAARALRRSPGFALTAIVSLALGIGVNTTIFSLTNEFLLNSPSCRNPETLAVVRLGGNSHLPMAEFRFVRNAGLFEGLAGLREPDEANWRSGEETHRLWASRVTTNFFEVTGVPVALGRPMQDSDQSATVISDHFWRNRLGADPNVLGRSLVLDGRPHTVIGVLPRTHRTFTGFGLAPDLYLPVEPDQTAVAVHLRLPQGMTRQEILDRLTSVGKELDRVFPQPDSSWTKDIRITPIEGFERLRSSSPAAIAAFFGLLMAVVALVLLIACANVASLLLARSSSRRQELAMRLAIGASRSRIIRQLLTESLLLAMLGAIAGFVLNLGLTSLFNSVQLPLPLPVRLMIQPDTRLLLYSSILALLSALFAGLGPALKATRVELNSALKQSEHQVGQRRWNLRSTLVVGQLAVSILLLGVGFLFARNLLKSTTMGPGFDVDRTLWAYVRLVPAKYSTPKQIRAFIDREIEILRATPGVESAAINRIVPLNNSSATFEPFQIDNEPAKYRMRLQVNNVGPDYFRTMGIPILAGDEFKASDPDQVIIINESLARRAFGSRNPVGRTIRFGKRAPVVIGLAKNSKYFTLGEENAPAIYEPYAAQSLSEVNLNFMVRASRLSPADLVKPLTKALGALDPSAAIEVKPMRHAMGMALLPSQVGAALLGSIGLLALTLASIGLYGVLFYTVSRRIREIGLRVALGARPASILRMVFGESFLLVSLGFGIGLGIALLITRPLAMFLVPGLSPADPLSYLAVTAVLTIVAITATTAPALHALRVDPLTALRYE